MRAAWSTLNKEAGAFNRDHGQLKKRPPEGAPASTPLGNVDLQNLVLNRYNKNFHPVRSRCQQ